MTSVEVRYFTTDNGRQPVIEWLRELRNRRGSAVIVTRLDRLANGNPGDVRSVGGGVSELRIHWGPGYRVYFAYVNPSLALMLAAGSKGTQQRDIKEAQSRWQHLKNES